VGQQMLDMLADHIIIACATCRHHHSAHQPYCSTGVLFRKRWLDHTEDCETCHEYTWFIGPFMEDHDTD
jgi:hypothetical protein